MATRGDTTIWVDVEDFLHYFDHNPRPSGIQRLSFEIMRALAGRPGIRFVRRGDGAGPLLREVPFAQVDAVFHRPAARPKPTPARQRRTRVLDAIHRLPPEQTQPLLRAGLLQMQVGRQLRALLRGGAAVAGAPARAAIEGQRPGDWLLVLGAPWAVPGFPPLVEALRRDAGMRVALLAYDLVPARHPEWCTPGLVAEFDAFLDATLPQMDRVLAISRHTASDVEAYAAERRLALHGPVVPIPIGTGFGEAGPSDDPPAAGLPPAGSYVLYVSTLEARKNHALAVRVWRRLAEEVRTGRRPAASLPTLVFAGRVGWLVADMLQQLENTAWVGGRVRLIQDPTDAELRALYDGCLFTLVPSLFEGWGLTVTESLAAGKPCLSSNAAALPEAGGALGRWFDPENLNDAHHAVAAVLDDPAGLAAWQTQVRERFRPTSWDETAASVLAALEADPA